MSIVMNKLICSFKSDLPNEIEFAMQVATILANTDNFSWSNDYPLVDAICSSLHVLTCICKDDITLACDCYPRFWHKLLTGDHANNPYLQLATLNKDTEQSYLSFNSLTNHELGNHTKIYKRIKTAAELIKQFSMSCDITLKSEKQQPTIDDLNNRPTWQPVPKKRQKASPPLLKFVSLLVFCDDTTLNLIGLDILSNIASKLSKLPEQTSDLTCTKLVQMFQEHCIDNISCQDGDIYLIIRSIEIVSRLIASSNSRVYSSVISLMNERDIILRIEQLLTSRNDVNLFLAALEFFYRVSRHQPHLIASRRAHHLIKILVNLLDCEDKQFFTETALKRIVLVDNEEPIDWTPQASESRTTLTQVNRPAVMVSTGTTTTSTSTTATATPANQQPTYQYKNATTNGVVTNGIKENGPMTTTAKPVKRPPPPPPQQTPTTPAPSVAANPPPTTPTPTTNNSNHTQGSMPSQPPQQSQQPASQPPPQLTQQPSVPQPTILQQPAREYTFHVGSLGPSEVSTCQWTSPNGTGPGCTTKRPKYSLLTHLNDFHCNATALERAINRSEPIKPPEHPGYGPNAALLAIRRHASLEKNGTRLQSHSPLSVSVRLTAALILRNLATESTEMKQALANHEPLLSEICMTNGRDESKILAECLSLFSSD